MESYLYEDLSLFNGELLEDPLVTEPEQLKDGSSGIEASSILAHPQNGSNDLGLVDLFVSSPAQDLPDPYASSSAWMDTNTDLLDLLSEPAPVEDHTTQTIVNVTIPDSPTDAALVPQWEVSNNIESLEAIQDLLFADIPVPQPTAAVNQTSNADIDILEELNEAGLEELLSSSSSSILDAPILSPVSAQDVDSLLSSNPPSPTASLSNLFDSFTESSQTATCDDFGSDYADDYSVIPVPSSKSRPAPYSKTSRKSRVGDRKERKKEQNRTAALRYRNKKREESETLEQQADGLEAKNKELRDKVDSMTREINYLKDLMADVLKARSKAKRRV